MVTKNDRDNVMSNDIGYSKWEPAPKQATQYRESVCLARPLPHPCPHDHHHEPITVPSHPRRQTGTRAASVCDMLAAWAHVSQTRSSSGATKLGGPGGQAGKGSACPDLTGRGRASQVRGKWLKMKQRKRNKSKHANSLSIN